MNEYIHALVSMQLRYKLVHWYSYNYMVHLATDKFIDSANDLFDEMIETARAQAPDDRVGKFNLEVDTFAGPRTTLESLVQAVREDIEATKQYEVRGSNPIIASQLDQLGAYLSVLANNLAMITKSGGIVAPVAT